MPCLSIRDGFVCIGNEPIEIQHKEKVYLFEWTGGCGWMPINKDGSERLS